MSWTGKMSEFCVSIMSLIIKHVSKTVNYVLKLLNKQANRKWRHPPALLWTQLTFVTFSYSVRRKPPHVTDSIKVEIMTPTMWAGASALIMQIISVHLRLIKLHIGLNNFLNTDDSPRWFISFNGSVNAEDARLQQHWGAQTLSSEWPIKE